MTYRIHSLEVDWVRVFPKERGYKRKSINSKLKNENPKDK